MASERNSKHNAGGRDRASGQISPSSLARLDDDKIAKALLGPDERIQQCAKRRWWVRMFDWLRFESDNC